MELLTEQQVEGGRGSREAKAIESIQGYYESAEVPFGVVYTWHPRCVLAVCGCGKPLSLTCSTATCSECGADHESMVREELEGECLQEDKALHPWRYAGNREGYGLPF
jgi:hypothetical protein